jgi:hypothetical protein
MASTTNDVPPTKGEQPSENTAPSEAVAQTEQTEQNGDEAAQMECMWKYKT